MEILVVVDYFLPGYKWGGPTRTIANIVSHLGTEFNFHVLTRDRDFEDSHPYPNCPTNRWIEAYGCKVYYLSHKQLSLRKLRCVIHSKTFNLIYLNGFFSTLTIKILLLHRLGLIPKPPLLLAPRGEFSPGALTLKRKKKHLYIIVAKLLGLYQGITFQASSPFEKQHIQEYFLSQAVKIAPNLPPKVKSNSSVTMTRNKRLGSVQLVFLSRISRKKNLHGALEMLSGIKGEVIFNIYGPEEDTAYTEECHSLVNQLPPNIVCRFRGPIRHEQVPEILASHHFFFLPTLGENFGHAILEALNCGLPVIISDQTPWQNLEEQLAGWDLQLSAPERFHEVVQHCVDMDNDTYQRWSRSARALG